MLAPLIGRRAPADRRVRVGVAGEQRALEEEQAGRPHRRRAAEPRQQELPEQRLDPEEQERAEEDRRAERIEPARRRGRSVWHPRRYFLMTSALVPSPVRGPLRSRSSTRSVFPIANPVS